MLAKRMSIAVRQGSKEACSKRRKVVIEGKSQRDVVKELGHSCKTIAKALELRIPPGYRLSKPRPRPVIEPVKRIVNRNRLL